MPRGIRRAVTRETLEEELVRADIDIQRCQKKLSELKLKRKRLVQQKDAFIYGALVEELKHSGRSPEELIAQLSAQ